MERANCRGAKHPEWWFSNNAEEQEAALHVCADCQVRAECAVHAMSSPDSAGVGIFGGLRPEQRVGKPVKKRRRAA